MLKDIYKNLIDEDDIIMEEESKEAVSSMQHTHTASISEIQLRQHNSGYSNNTGYEISKLVKLIKQNSNGQSELGKNNSYNNSSVNQEPRVQTGRQPISSENEIKELYGTARKTDESGSITAEKLLKNSEKRTTGKKPKKLENLKIEIARFDDILRQTPKNDVSSFLNEKIEDIEIKSKTVTPKSEKPSEEK